MRRSLFLAAMCAAGLAAALAHADDHPIYYYAGASAGSVTAANAWSSKNNTTDIVPADFESGNVIYRMAGSQDILIATMAPNLEAKVYGILWYRGWGSFELRNAANAKLLIGAGGMAPDGSMVGDRQFYLRMQVVLTADQTWRVGQATHVLQVTGGLQGDYSIDKTGPGVLLIGGDTGTFNVYDWPKTVIAGGTVRMAQANIFSAGHELVFSGTNATQRAVLDLSTFNETLEDVLWYEAPGTCANNELTSGGPASKMSVIFTGEPQLNPTGFGGSLRNGAGVTWNPDDPAENADPFVFVFTNAVSDTQGHLDVQNGVMRVADGASFTALSLVSVGAKGRFEVAAGGAVAGTALEVADGGKVAVAEDVTIVFDAASYAGSALVGGTYTKANCAWIEGDGSVLVAGNSWTGGGGADTSMDNWANWGGLAQDLTGGNLTAIFAAGGAMATIPGNMLAVLRGIIFQGNSDFELAAGEGGGVSVTGQGIQTAGAATARTFTITAPLDISGSQFLVPNENDKLVLSNVVSGTAAFSKDGTGQLHLWGDNTFSGDLNVLNGRVYAHSDNAFGTTAGRTILTQSKGYVYLDGVTTHETFVLTKGFNYPVVGVAGKVSHVYGMLDNVNGGNWGLNAESGGELHCHGGLWGSGNFSFDRLYIDDTPMHLADRLSATGAIYLNVASNWVGNNHTLINNNCRIYCRVPYAYYRGPRNEPDYGVNGKNTSKVSYLTRITFNSTGVGIFDLGGYDQEVAQFFCSSANSRSSCVTSSVPAQLHLYCDRRDNLTATDTMARNYTKFVDAAGLTIDYFSNYAITLFSVSSTTGRLEVADKVNPTAASSVLTLGDGSTGGWPNASEVRVTGGTLEFTHAQCIGKQTDVYLDPANGTIKLSNASPQSCRFLYVWDAAAGAYRHKMSKRTYGAIGSGAQVEMAGFGGTGLLYPTGISGMTVFIR